MGPLWDFDVIMKSGGWDEIHGRYFFKGLFASENRTFVRSYVSLWENNKEMVFDGLSHSLDRFLASDLRQAVDASIELNNSRWSAEMGRLPLSSVFVEAAKTYFNQRKVWLEENIDQQLGVK